MPTDPAVATAAPAVTTVEGAEVAEAVELAWPLLVLVLTMVVGTAT